jgi:hypothetical protein
VTSPLVNTVTVSSRGKPLNIKCYAQIRSLPDTCQSCRVIAAGIYKRQLRDIVLRQSAAIARRARRSTPSASSMRIAAGFWQKFTGLGARLVMLRSGCRETRCSARQKGGWLVAGEIESNRLRQTFPEGPSFRKSPCPLRYAKRRRRPPLLALTESDEVFRICEPGAWLPNH